MKTEARTASHRSLGGRRDDRHVFRGRSEFKIYQLFRFRSTQIPGVDVSTAVSNGFHLRQIEPPPSTAARGWPGPNGTEVPSLIFSRFLGPTISLRSRIRCSRTKPSSRRTLTSTPPANVTANVYAPRPIRFTITARDAAQNCNQTSPTFRLKIQRHVRSHGRTLRCFIPRRIHIGLA